MDSDQIIENEFLIWGLNVESHENFISVKVTHICTVSCFSLAVVFKGNHKIVKLSQFLWIFSSKIEYGVVVIAVATYRRCVSRLLCSLTKHFRNKSTVSWQTFTLVTCEYFLMFYSCFCVIVLNLSVVCDKWILKCWYISRSLLIHHVSVYWCLCVLSGGSRLVCKGSF